jgi:peptidoglycan/LPS O-acetylase OafA/YrhL
LAAFFVFSWHFIHARSGFPIPFTYTPDIIPLALLDEGHTGVALFMTLSGYLFAKLLDGKSINYRAFFLNRVLRLLPLLLLVLVVIGLRKLAAGDSIADYLYSIAKGVILPTLPNGGWSITVEFHYYVLLPPLLWLFRKSKFLPLLVIAAAISVRLILFGYRGEIQTLAYWTLIGRIDQFVLGMLAYQFRNRFEGHHVLAFGTTAAFTSFYWLFDTGGGFYFSPSYPSPSPLWIIMPTLEATAYATLIAWYDNSFKLPTTGWSRLLGRVGEFSYSIYLLHFFFVFEAARFINHQVFDLSNFYVACGWSLLAFLLMVPLGYLSFRFVEAPFLKLRVPYVIADTP